MWNSLHQSFSSILVLIFCLFSSPLHAALDIEIFGGGASQIPISIIPFAAEERLAQSVTAVVRSDLQRSGLFRMVDSVSSIPHEPSEIIYPDFYSNIDLIYKGEHGQLSYNFMIHPGANINSIAFSFDGAESIQLREDELVVSHRFGELIQSKPKA